jgi:hypothetical protein
LNLKDSAPAARPLREAFERQRHARDSTSAPTYRERLAALAALESMLRSATRELCDAVDADFQGRAAEETRLLEIFPALEGASHARRHLRRWMRPQRRATSVWFLPGRSRVMFQALGVVGVVVPWNYPIYLAAGPIVSALAAGNRILVKMSEAAPQRESYRRLVARHFDPALLSIVNGGPTSREPVSLPDHLPLPVHGGRARCDARGGREPHARPLSWGQVARHRGARSTSPRLPARSCTANARTPARRVAPDYADSRGAHRGLRPRRASVERMYPQLAKNAQYSSIVNARHRSAWQPPTRHAARARESRR